MIALVALSVAGIPLVATLGYVTAIAVLTAVSLPSRCFRRCSALGGHLFGSRLPAFLTAQATRARVTSVSGHGGWGSSTGHPWSGPWASRLLIMIPSLIPMFSLTLGEEDIGTTPTSTTERRAFDMMSAGFGPGYNGPLLVAGPSLDPRRGAERGVPTSQYNQAMALKNGPDGQADVYAANQSSTLKAQQAPLAQQAALESQGAAHPAAGRAARAERGAEGPGGQLMAQEAALEQQEAQLKAEQAALELRAESLPRRSSG